MPSRLIKSKSTDERQSKTKSELDGSNFSSLLQSGKIDEASRLISKMLDVSSGGERVLSSLQDFLKGERFDESLEMLTLMANLSQRHQVKLVKLFMCGNTALHVEGESEESYARRLVNDMGFVERMRIYSLEIFVSLAERVVALRQQSPLSEVREMFASFVYAGLLQGDCSEAVSYLDWLKLTLQTAYVHQVTSSSSHKLTLNNFSPKVNDWAVIEQAFNMVEDEKSIVFVPITNTPATVTLLDLWMVFRANLRVWSSERASLFISTFICYFSALWDILSDIFPEITLVKLPFDTELFKTQTANSAENANSENDGVSFINENLHVSDKVTSQFNSSLVQSEARIAVDQCLRFLEDVAEFVLDDVYQFKMSLKMAVDVLKELDLDQTEPVQKFMGVLANFVNTEDKILEGIKMSAPSRHIERLCRAYDRSDQSNRDTNYAAAITQFWTLWSKSKAVVIDTNDSAFPVSGSACLLLDSCDVPKFAVAILAHFLHEQIVCNGIKATFDPNPDYYLSLALIVLQFGWPSLAQFQIGLENFLRQETPEGFKVVFKQETWTCLLVPQVISSITLLVRKKHLRVYQQEKDANDQEFIQQLIPDEKVIENMEKCLKNSANIDKKTRNSILLSFLVSNFIKS